MVWVAVYAAVYAAVRLAAYPTRICRRAVHVSSTLCLGVIFTLPWSISCAPEIPTFDSGTLWWIAFGKGQAGIVSSAIVSSAIVSSAIVRGRRASSVVA